MNHPSPGTTALHPFDAALVLIPLGEAHSYQLPTSDAYWNMAGPFGGWLFAAGLKAILTEAEVGLAPVEAHGRFYSAARSGTLTVRVERQQQGRSLGFWRALITQEQGAESRLCCEVSVILASWRETRDVTIEAIPTAPDPQSVARAQLANAPVRWLDHYDFRYISGVPFRNDQSESAKHLQTRTWVRESEGRALDWLNLVAIADVAIPRVFLLQQSPSPIATVSMSVYFHVTQAEIDESASPWILLDIGCHSVRRGFFDHTASLWREDGRLLATTTQLAWFL
jgi:acyl-CoA thioesterase